jgi:hypothetical protein
MKNPQKTGIITILLFIGIIIFMSCEGNGNNNGNGNENGNGNGNGEKDTETGSIPKIGETVEGKGKLIWHDEFEGPNLDTTKWNLAPQWTRQDRSSWRNDMVSLRDGNLVITARRDTELGQQQAPANATNRQALVDNWVRSGGIRSRSQNGNNMLFQHSFGYYEARIKFPQMQGTWGAFWLMYNTTGGYSLDGTNGTEIDIIESIDNHRTLSQGNYNHAIHWNGYGTGTRSVGSGNPAAAFPAGSGVTRGRNAETGVNIYDGNFHIFALKWTPNEYIFYVNGIENWRLTAGNTPTASYWTHRPPGGPIGYPNTVIGINRSPNYIKLSMESAAWAGLLPADWNDEIEMLVDYVRVYELVD